MLRRALNIVLEIFWALMLALMPITSLPLLSRLAGSAMVMPPSVVPLLGLALLWLAPQLARRRALPPQAGPLLAFSGVALLSSLLAFYIPFPPFRNASYAGHMLQAGITLAIGVSTYLVVAMFPRDQAGLARSLRWIDLGGVVLIIYSLAQAYFWYTTRDYPTWMSELQKWLSVSMLFPQRVTGLAFEPSWLAHQLNMLYLPLWLAASVRRYSSYPFRILGVTAENLLLLGGLATLGFSISRVGWLAALLMVCFLLLKGNIWLIGSLRAWIERRSGQSHRASHWNSALLTAGLLTGLLAFYFLLFLGAGLAISKADPRMAKLFSLSALQEQGFTAYANQLQFAERVVFWETGWEVFNDYPILGVGLGNTGYYFPQKMSTIGWALTEVNQIIFHQDAVPNSKSMWSRILAETGLIGFALFLTWGLVLWFTGSRLAGGSGAGWRTAGLAVQLLLVAFLVEGFSIDSFALPYLWVGLGLATTAARLNAPAGPANGSEKATAP